MRGLDRLEDVPLRQLLAALRDETDQAIVAYDRDDFMRRRLDGLRDRLRRLGARRVFLPDGSYLRRLTPDFRLVDTVEF